MYRKKGQERITGIQLGNYIAKFNPFFKKSQWMEHKKTKIKKNIEKRKKEKKGKKLKKKLVVFNLAAKLLYSILRSSTLVFKNSQRKKL